MNYLNRETYKWNIVYRTIMELKDLYEKENNKIACCTVYSKTTNSGSITEYSCVEYWADNVKTSKYRDIFKTLEINQEGYNVLFRYGNYSSNSNGEEEITMWDSEYWQLYGGIYQECRSVVIDVYREEIVIAPFKKFRNLNECEETSLENVKKRIEKAKTVEISNKLDGSMQCASINSIGELVYTGAQAVSEKNSWRVLEGKTMLLEQDNYIRMIEENPNFTFIFEFISLNNPLVVVYTKEQEGLYLIGIRDKITGEQFSYGFLMDMVRIYGIDKHTEVYNTTLDTVLSELDKYKSNEREGVVMFVDGFMVKIKYNDYVQIHRYLSKLASPNLIIRAMADNTIDDLLSKIPQAYRECFDKIVKLVISTVTKKEKIVDNYYNRCLQETNNTSRKDVMIWIQQQVPIEYRSYVINKYLEKPYSFLKKKAQSKTPQYATWTSLGLQQEMVDFE